MAKKHADKIDPAAKPRAPRRAAKSSAATPAAAVDLAAGVTTSSQRAEASDMGSPGAIGDAPLPAATSDPSYDDIARAAYERYLSRGGDHGRDFEDWLEAERELRKR
jgi:hypothetical protein